VTLLMAQLQLAEVAHEDRRAVALGDYDVAQVLQGLHHPDAADDVAKLAAVQDAATGICAVGVDRVGDVLEGEIEPNELLRVELELKLSRQAAEILHISDTRNLLQCRNYHPSLDFRKLAQILGSRLERVVENLAGWRG